MYYIFVAQNTKGLHIMKKTIIFLIILFLICLGVAGFALYKIHTESVEVSKAEELSRQYEEYSPAEYFTSGTDYSSIYNSFMPSLTAMQEINPQVTGWLYIPVTHIDYPLLQGDDNSYYLTHTVNKEYSVAGSIFTDKRGFGKNGQNTVIYGHNMGRSSDIMFHDITNFVDPAWFEKVQTGYIITKDGIIELNIFAYSLTKPQTEYYYDDVTVDFIKQNAVNYREPKTNGSIYTLSTCAYDYKEARAVLNCMGDFVWEKGSL
jgi:sortase B